jgi:hypothetical protein
MAKRAKSNLGSEFRSTLSRAGGRQARVRAEVDPATGRRRATVLGGASSGAKSNK